MPQIFEVIDGEDLHRFNPFDEAGRHISLNTMGGAYKRKYAGHSSRRTTGTKILAEDPSTLEDKYGPVLMTWDANALRGIVPDTTSVAKIRFVDPTVTELPILGWRDVIIGIDVSQTAVNLAAGFLAEFAFLAVQDLLDISINLVGDTVTLTSTNANKAHTFFNDFAIFVDTYGMTFTPNMSGGCTALPAAGSITVDVQPKHKDALVLGLSEAKGAWIATGTSFEDSIFAMQPHSHVSEATGFNPTFSGTF